MPIPHILEQLVEGVEEIPQEHFPEQTVEQIVDAIERVSPEAGVPCATPIPALNTYPHENFDEACRILGLKQAELREADLILCNILASLRCGGRFQGQASLRIRQGDCGEIPTGALCLPCPSTSSKDKRSLIEYTKTLRRPREKNRGAKVDIHMLMRLMTRSITRC